MGDQEDTMVQDTTTPAGETGSRFMRGMLGFASIMLMLNGGFHVVGGFVALLEKDYYQVGSSELVVSVSYTAWGIAHMALGTVVFLAGVALFYRQPWARVVAVIVAAFSALTNLTFLSAAPVWFALMIVLDVIVIYAATVHFDDEQPEIDY